MINYADGSTQTIVTDESWKASTGGFFYGDIYDGESYDASLEPQGWNKNGFDDTSWKCVLAANVDAAPLITPRRDQPVRVCDELIPLSVVEISKGVFIFDFGQNMVGVPRITVKGKKGEPIVLRFAEMLNEDGTMYTENYRSAHSTDYVKPADNKIFTYQPKFTFHGFRYMEISGLADGWKPTVDSVRGLVMHNDMPLTGTFICSNHKLNKLQSNIQWGQRGNYLSVPTDCPQRDERAGWTGDAQVFIPTGTFNMNVNGFFSKWNLDMKDIQGPDGIAHHVVPMGWGGGSPAWADAAVVCPWTIYLAYGDKKALAENFDMMKKWVDYMKNTSKNLIRPDCGFGDWLQPSTTHGKDSRFWRGQVPRPLIGTAYFARAAEIVSKSAKILGKNEDAKKYAKLASDVRDAFVKEFILEDGSIKKSISEGDLEKGECQTAYLLPLAFDLLPENLREKCFKKLIKTFEKTNWNLDTGFVGTPLICPVFSKFGRDDLAYRIVSNEDYPSWIFSINQGATTIWERWNSYVKGKGFGESTMNSFNHYAYGAIGEWLYRTVGGIWYDEANAGYKNIIFAPKFGGNLTFAAATHETPYGSASSNWKIEGNKAYWTVIVPSNATGTLTFPVFKDVTMNGKKVSEPTVNVKSGTYEITMKL